MSTIIANSEAMLRVVQQVRLAIGGRAALVLEGEPGTGKEHIARVIHHETARRIHQALDFRQESFVPLDWRGCCPSISSERCGGCLRASARRMRNRLPLSRR